MTGEIAVSVRNVSKRYLLYNHPRDRLKQSLFARFGRNYACEYWALRALNFEVRRGETLGVIGQNGSGKSTLLQIIAGTLQPTEGDVLTRGRVAALLELGSGFNPEFTGRENVFLNGAILGISELEMKERFEEIVSFAQIDNYIDQPVKTYSSGMFMRLAFAVAVCVDPDILIVDEALSVGDSLFQSRSYRRMQEMRDSGKTIIFVTHDFYTVQSFCDRALLLDHGQVIKMGEAKPVVNRYIELLATREREYIEGLESQLKDSARTATNKKGPAAASHATVRLEQNTIKEEFRFGTRAAEIVDIYLLNGDGERAAVWNTGEAGTVVVIVRFNERLERPIVGFIVNTPTGINVFGTNSWYSENEPGPQEPGTLLRAEFRQRIQLNPGTYILTCSVAEKKPDGIAMLDSRMDAMSFKVTSQKPLYSGIVDMETLIQYVPLSTEELHR